MTRTKARFTQAEINRAVKAVLQGGSGGRIRVNSAGEIVIEVGGTTDEDRDAERDQAEAAERLKRLREEWGSKGRRPARRQTIFKKRG